MRTQLLKQGFILATVGTLFMLVGTLTATNQTTTNTQSIYSISQTYARLTDHEYTTPVDLQPGTYQLKYTFNSTQPIDEFSAVVLDPDSYELNSTLGPPTAYHGPMTLNFQTPKPGQHTLKLGGTWTAVQADLYRLTQTTKTAYPYEITIYIGVTLFVIGVPLSLIGASIKEKHPRQWYD